MEKITDEELKKLLTKQETPTTITNEETGEVQWTRASKEEVKEAFSNVIDAVIPEVNEDNLQDSLEQDIDFNTIPDLSNSDFGEVMSNPIIDNRKDFDFGLGPDELKAFSEYVLGKAERPDFLEKFTADAEGRIKDMAMLVTLVQMNRLPVLCALSQQVQDRLFTPTNLAEMNAAVLTATMNNLNKSITGTVDGAMKIIQTVSQFGGLNSQYRTLLDGIIQLPPDKLEKLQEYVFTEKSEK